jgi:sugar phosphate permease
VALFTLANSSDAFILLRATSCGVPAAWVPLLWTGINLVRVLLSVPGGMLADRMDRRRAIAMGWLIYAGVYAGLARTSTLAPFLVLVGVYGFYHALSESALKAFVADLVTPDARGRAYGLYHFAVGVGSLPASYGFGKIWTHYGPAAAFAVGASLSLLAALALLAVVRPRPASD